MAFPRVSWRVGLPFVLLVLLASVALAWFTSNRLTAAEDERFERVAVTTGLYIDNSSLPPSRELANDLQRITGNTVLFRRDGRLEPPPPLHLAGLPLTTLPADTATRNVPSGALGGTVKLVLQQPDVPITSGVVMPGPLTTPSV